MKSILTITFLFLANNLFAQKFTGQIAEFKLPATELVIFPFGMEYPLKIGTIDKEGQVQLNLNDVDIASIPEDVKSSFFGRVSESFFSPCDSPDLLGISNEIKALKSGALFLYTNKEQTGVLFLVSNEKLKPWLEDRYYIEPVEASFFEMLYVDQDINIDNSCKTTYNLESGNVVAENNFTLNLIKGFNLVEYKIEQIHKTNPEETSSIPVKLQIINAKVDAEIKWMVKYF